MTKLKNPLRSLDMGQMIYNIIAYHEQIQCVKLGGSNHVVGGYTYIA